MTMDGREVRCTRCDKLLALDRIDHLEIKNGRKAVRVSGDAVVSIDCSRCGQTIEVPRALQKPVGA